MTDLKQHPYMHPSIRVLKLEGDDYDPVANFVVVIGKFNPRRKYFRLVQRKDGRWCVPLRDQMAYMDAVKMAVGALRLENFRSDRVEYAPLNCDADITRQERADAVSTLELARQYLPIAGVHI